MTQRHRFMVLNRGSGAQATPQDRYPPMPEPSGRPEADAEERRVGIARSEEAGGLSRAAGVPEGSLDMRWDHVQARGEEEKREVKHKGDRLGRLGHRIRKIIGSAEGRTERIRAMEELLKQTEELLAARSAELSGTQTFLSTTDDLSEVEVLGIVRELNENIYQVAVKLTEEWEMLESPRATSQMDVDPTSQPHIPTLVQLVRNRDPTGLTPLLQSCLCFQAVNMTSSWGHDRESAVLEPIYQQLSVSGEHCIICSGGV